jgi:hypothetical protein
VPYLSQMIGPGVKKLSYGEKVPKLSLLWHFQSRGHLYKMISGSG